MKNQAYRMALLYDFYGDTLTDRQKEFYDLYYNEDKTGIIRRFHVMQDQLKDLLSSVEAIRKRNDQLYQDSEIETLTESISSVLETLKQE